ncbi:hypothetical protein [Gimesia maris]|uniref:hypothetical protein n=1 Tax=Gimesia maris TaxID=122 RepID=UPI003A925F6B
MPNPHWRYFLALEAQFANTLRYVELADANYDTYSIEFASILLAAASEVDVIAKLVCSGLDSTLTVRNIDSYRNCIRRHFPHFHKIKVALPIHEITLQPWSSWNSGTNPAWWKAYNNVKHQRNKHYSDATLRNSMNALAGLLCILLYHLAPLAQSWAIYPFPQLFTYNGIMSPGPLKGPPSIVLPDH